MTRTLALLAVASATACAQFNSLATPSDGSAVYFTTTLRLKGAYESPWGKVFAADERGVRLVVSRELRKPLLPDNYAGNCFLGPLIGFYAVELSADGKALASPGRRWTAGQCHGAGVATLLRSPAGSRDVSGRLRLSANGRWAVVDTTFTVFSAATAYVLDLATGNRTDAQFQSLGSINFASGRTIADDGTAVFSLNQRTYVLRPGAGRQQVPYGFPLAISASGARVLLSFTGAVHLFDLRTQQDEQLSTSHRAFRSAGLSDDGSRAAFLQNQQLYVADFGGGGARQVSTVADGITSAVLSGSGKIAYAATGTGRLVKIAVETGDTTEIIGRTPDLVTTGGIVDAGMFTTLGGHGFADQTYTASAPLPYTLGGVRARVGGREVPISRVTPTAIDVLIPWDVSGAADLPVVVDAPAPGSPFDAPQGTLTVQRGARAGALYRKDWTPLTNLNVHAGEIIHVFAAGLGGVAPEVTPGAAAPSSEPLARLAAPMSCTNATVLYAGLQPGTVARVYQVDMQIGAKTGYQQFSCTIGAGNPFVFPTLNVVP